MTDSKLLIIVRGLQETAEEKAKILGIKEAEEDIKNIYKVAHDLIDFWEVEDPITERKVFEALTAIKNLINNEGGFINV